MYFPLQIVAQFLMELCGSIWISIYVQVCMQMQYISEKQGDKQKWHVIDSLLVMLNDMILCVPADCYGKIYLP